MRGEKGARHEEIAGVVARSHAETMSNGRGASFRRNHIARIQRNRGEIAFGAGDAVVERAEVGECESDEI
jgi:hypothetical protein